MAANTVMASDDEKPPATRNDSDTKYYNAPVIYNGTNVGNFCHIVYWEWDYTYVIDWDLSYIATQGAQGLYRSLFLGAIQDSANYVNRVECISEAMFGIYFYGDTGYKNRLGIVVVTIETVHYADGSYIRIT
ncbi:MAG: hypothetical protein GX226_03345 [Dehalococcoidales bacterium]|nr:hypothetical protein [Dehalococcoidales bacterium]